MTETPDTAATLLRLMSLYNAAGPRLGCMLVEANVLLLLADLRGQTNLLLFEPTETDVRQVAQLQPRFFELGLRWRTAEAETTGATGRRYVVFVLESLAGYAFIARHTHMRGITPFDQALGWEGVEAWGKAAFDALRVHYEPEPVLLDRWIGLCLGYPDRAIDDACAAIQQGKGFAGFIKAHLPAVDLYGGAQPIFSYAPEHADDAGIVETIATWERLLSGVYASEWHQQLAADPAFQAARSSREAR